MSDLPPQFGKVNVQIEVSYDLIAQAIGLPEGVEIIQATPIVRWSGESVSLYLYVHVPDLPPIPEGKWVPIARPKMTLLSDKGPRTWLRIDWGLPALGTTEV